MDELQKHDACIQESQPNQRRVEGKIDGKNVFK